MTDDSRRGSLEAIREPVRKECADLEGYFRTYLKTDVSVIDRIFEHLLDGGGKRFRPLLVLLIASFREQPLDEDVFRLAVSVEFIHTATLLHDDVVDQSDLRRGNRVAYRLWGAEPSVLSGDYLYSRAFSLLVEIGHLGILESLSSATTSMARGEVLQLLRSFSTATSREEYLEVIEGKTASLISASCVSAGYLAGFNGDRIEALRGFGTNLGFSFQIVDDILDYSADLGELGKAIGKDFLEGKVTLPVILLIEELKAEERRRVADIFLKSSPDPEDFQWVLSRMKDRDILDKAMDAANRYAEQAQDSLSALPEGAVRESLVDLARYVTRRRK
ncbi:MAG: polyprenyl synthetase family protein [bacterium]|nr:MAG: polyprenyl synthetase family protein [bacterium]